MNQELFPSQQKTLQIIDELRPLLARYIDDDLKQRLQQIEQDTQNFQVRIPIVGAFSCGKSSVLNALLGEKLLKTDINPETAVPTELGYAQIETLTAYLSDGTHRPLLRDELVENRLDDLAPNGWVAARLSNAALAELPHLLLVDMPGWDSGNNRHAQAIDNYISRSLAYCIMVSAEEGTLHQSIRAALQELALYQLPIIVVISKADKKPAEDIAAVAEQVCLEITQLLGKQPLRVVTTRKRDCGNLLEALREIEKNAEPIFIRHIGARLKGELADLADYLQTLLLRADLGSEELEMKREELHSQINAIHLRVEEETQVLQNNLPRVQDTILRRITDSLYAQTESLTSQAENGRDLRDPIDRTVRLALTEGVRDVFGPELERYFGQTNTMLQQDYQFHIQQASLPTATQSKEFQTLAGVGIGAVAGEMLIAPLSVVLLPVLGPFAPVAGLLLGGLIGGLLGKLSGANASPPAEVKAAEQREHIRSQITGTVIPQVINQVRMALQPMLMQQVTQAQATITASVAQKHQQLDTALRQLGEELAEGQAAFSAAQQQHRADLAVVNSLTGKLPA